ncbi:hypothetical protein GCM10011391_05380 [Pullulanibacillus camelliae]|uniref:histidine kinase n=1 Tax=Pullulanibacillus camelliae TaxID=1707096 RepID=A0A8J2VKW1_9BACL|nr:methyl-accepting chemotaxis protein [Pullulanibacillus camelliae]GGE29769.1 hypothetical protein GCM10011391_05380 [Pullulanibacillus camelliae]
MKHSKSLRRQFLIRILIALLIIVILSGTVQLFYIKRQIANNVESQASIVASNVIDGISQTEKASQSIEHQIDLKMVGYAKYIGQALRGKSVNEITNAELKKLSEQLNVQGITVFARKGNDIVGLKATDPQEIGFSFRKISDEAYNSMEGMLHGKAPGKSVVATYKTKNIGVSPISQSGSHEKPVFNKYAYYHEPGTNYIINPYIEANQVYKFTQDVGPDQQIKRTLKSNSNIKEIAVLNPKVFKNPSLAKALYSPQKKVEYGTFNLKTHKNVQWLKKQANKPKRFSTVNTVKGTKLYQTFVPTKDGKLVYIAYDYKAMSAPLYRHSIILIITGLLSLVVLFLLTARFFNHIYDGIQRIKHQINQLASGNLTVKSEVKYGHELQMLSDSTNQMVDQLNQLVKSTHFSATKTQRLATLLEAEASNSVEKVYQFSAEATMKAREELFEVTKFLDESERNLQRYVDDERIKPLLKQIQLIREIADNRTTATTEMTLNLSDLLTSLHEQASELSELSAKLIESMEEFTL